MSILFFFGYNPLHPENSRKNEALRESAAEALTNASVRRVGSTYEPYPGPFAPIDPQSALAIASTISAS